jgi:aldehyde:ferredoxin oxidoreductase
MCIRDRLKAIVLSGAHQIRCENEQKVRKLSQCCERYVRWNVPLPSAKTLPWLGRLVRILPFGFLVDGMISILLFRKWGTSGMNQMSVEWGDSPIKNWTGSELDYPLNKSAQISPDKVIDREIRKFHCYSCPLGCGGICVFDNRETHKPEYETIMAFGGLLLHDDLDAIFKINERLNRVGMDTISAGTVVAFAFEGYEKGWLPEEWAGDLDLSWGNTEAIHQVLELMIERKGLGALLADGVRKATERLNGLGIEAAIHAGGQEIALHDPRLDPGYALHASVEPTPGRHTTGAQSYYEMYRLWTKVKDLPKPHLLYSKDGKYRSDPEKIAAAVGTSCYTQLFNGLGLCMFGAFLGADRLPLFEWVNAATGWKKTPEDYLLIGRRIQTLRQMFNIKHGLDPHDFKISSRAIGLPPLKKGANRGRTVELDAMIQDYWTKIGWDRLTGIPLSRTVEELNLHDLIEEGE